MSFREIAMIEVRETLRRWTAGQSFRAIARNKPGDRKTVARYVAAAVECGFKRGDEVSDELVCKVSELVQERPLPPPSEQWQTLQAEHSRLEKWLSGDSPLTLVRAHELLMRDGVVISYTTLRRYAHRELAWRERPSTMRLEDPPFAEEAQIDVGQMGRLHDADGRLRKLWVLVVTLTASRYMFVWPTFEQTTAALCAGLDAGWRFFGGMPLRIVLDNMSAAVVKPDALAPTLQKGFLEYVQTRGLFADVARVRRPQDKARVENQIPFVRERWFAGEEFLDLVQCRVSAETWCRDVAGARVHGTTRRVPREVYDAHEKPSMRPAPESPFDVPVWKDPKVHPDRHIQVARALYGVPWPHRGKVDVRVDSTSVSIYQSRKLLMTYPRQRPGGRITGPNVYPPSKEPWALRSVDKVKQEAAAQGPHVSRFTNQLLDGPLPWSSIRQGYALLRLCSRYGAARVDELCARALSFNVIDVRRIERMLKSARKVEQSASASGKLVVLPARFARDASSFQTIKSTPEGGAQ